MLHDPREQGADALMQFADGLLVVEDGTIVAAGDYQSTVDRFPGIRIHDYSGRMIMPGFVDTHIHYPQTDRIAAYGHQLLDWLDQHIFPAEAAFSDPGLARNTAEFFLAELLRNGTTTALVFATVHEHSVDALFEGALHRNMRLISGKVLMDLGPPDLRDDPDGGRGASEALIRRWRGQGRLGYAVMPRFALTSSDTQLRLAGDLLAAHPDALLHTHLAENETEIAAVKQRFGDSSDYLGVYDGFGLVGPRSVFAHCIHLERSALQRMARAGACAALCPTSNLFLGSGLFDLAQLDAAGVRVGFGSDIGAGTSFSMFATLGEAYKISQLRGAPLDPLRALYLATAGGADILGIGDRVGRLAPGMEADFIVVEAGATPLLARRTAGRSLVERLFSLQILGDDRSIHATYVAGRCVYARQGDILQ